MIHHITEVGIIGMQNRSMVCIISWLSPVNVRYCLRCAVKLKNTIEQISASITESRYPTFPRLNVNSRNMLNTIFIAVVSMPSMAYSLTCPIDRTKSAQLLFTLPVVTYSTVSHA